MANSRGLTADDIGRMVRTIEAELRVTWAVYVDYDHEFMNHKIVKVVPWSERDYASKHIKVTANDQLEAFIKAGNILEDDKWIP